MLSSIVKKEAYINVLSSDVNKIFDDIVSNSKQRIEDYNKNGSNWIFDKVYYIDITLTFLIQNLIH